MEKNVVKMNHLFILSKLKLIIFREILLSNLILTKFIFSKNNYIVLIDYIFN